MAIRNRRLLWARRLWSWRSQRAGSPSAAAAKPPRFTTGTVDRGDVAEVVGATGTLQAVTTVQLGSQVSGTIQSLYADFNSTVKKDQVVARLDPSLFEARLGQARANVQAARANVDRAKAEVEDTRQKYERAKELAAGKLLPASDLDTREGHLRRRRRAAQGQPGGREPGAGQPEPGRASTSATRSSRRRSTAS